MKWLETHKHFAITVVIAMAAWFGLRAYVAMQVNLAQISAASAEKIKANELTAAKAQTVADRAQTANVGIDADTKRKLDGLQAQLNSKPNSEQIKGIVAGLLPGVTVTQGKDAQGNAVLSVDDTQANRDAINKADVEFKSCKFSLDGCEQKQANFKVIVEQKDIVIAAKQETIDTQASTIKELKSFGKGGNFWSRTGRVLLPVACAGGGAWLGATKGTKGAAIGALAGGGVCAVMAKF